MSILSVFMPSRDLHSHDGFVRVNLFDGTFFLSPIYVDPIAGFQHLCSLQLKLHQRAARRRYRCYFLIVTPAHALAAGDGPAAARPKRSHATQASDRASPLIARGEPRRHRGPSRRPACPGCCRQESSRPPASTRSKPNASTSPSTAALATTSSPATGNATRPVAGRESARVQQLPVR
jgi:hypothetical protein